MSAPRATPDVIELPTPLFRGDTSFEEVIQRRRSVREFAREPLTLAQISQLLWACQGLTGAGEGRSTPSAGATYPLEVYVARSGGIERYEPRGHRLERHLEGDRRPALFRAALSQDSLLSASVVFVIAAVYERTAYRYGKTRAERFVQMEAGQAAQNLLLQATAMGLGAVAVGAFEDERVRSILSLPPDQQPLYLIPAGRPR